MPTFEDEQDVYIGTVSRSVYIGEVDSDIDVGETSADVSMDISPEYFYQECSEEERRELAEQFEGKYFESYMGTANLEDLYAQLTAVMAENNIGVDEDGEFIHGINLRPVLRPENVRIPLNTGTETLDDMLLGRPGRVEPIAEGPLPVENIDMTQVPRAELVNAVNRLNLLSADEFQALPREIHEMLMQKLNAVRPIVVRETNPELRLIINNLHAGVVEESMINELKLLAAN